MSTFDIRRSFTSTDIPPDPLDRRSSRRASTGPPADHRLVRLGPGARNDGFCCNSIRTSKYTPLTFLPVNIVEQFHKFGNLYFLLVSILMWLGENTPLFVGTIKAFSTGATLVMMMAVSSFVAWLDDRRRHAADLETNSQEAAFVTPGGSLHTKTWDRVAVGDVLVVRDGEEFPADLVAIYCSGAGGTAYVSTANLDGETNLKVKEAVDPTQQLVEGPADEEALLQKLVDIKASVEVEPPQVSIHDFRARIQVNDGAFTSLCSQNLMLRGTRLRNTRLCLGIVVYTGPDTRVIRNSREAPLKQSNLETVTNRVMLVVLAAQAGLASLSTLLFLQNREKVHGQWYFAEAEVWLPQWLGSWLTFFVLYSNMMPISLYPTMEWCNSFHTLFIKNDAKMYYPELDFQANARASNLCQELGQVSYIFSDKTGTLTQNVMDLKRIWVGKQTFGHLVKERGFHGRADVLKARSEGVITRELDYLLETLAVAHTAVLLEDPKDPAKKKLEGESPDEIALVETAGHLGWSFVSRCGSSATVMVHPDAGPQGRVDYEVLAVNSFDSDRKRMSVLVRRNDKYVLLAKGADNVMLARALAKGQNHEEINEALYRFSTEGLRTLIVAVRELSAEQAEDWLEEYRAAQQSIDDRGQLLSSAAEEIEVDMEVVGITAIEDKLQDFVPETIQKLRQAGIKFWVLTGDKLETARNIGYSSRVIPTQACVVDLDLDLSLPADRILSSIGHSLEDALARFEPYDSTMRVLMITGAFLGRLLENSALSSTLLNLVQGCGAVIACRVSPLQKAQLVRLVREGASPAPVTLSVGDGANDVPMIQEAQVGVGIAGREGRQAVNNSDFAIGQFSHIQRLLLVHGRWNYRRACKFTLFTFWRNAFQVLMIFYYTFCCGFSGTVLFEDWIRLSFNFLCSFPIMATGCFDQDLMDTTALQNPSTYIFGREGRDLRVGTILESLILAVLHSLLLACILALTYPSFSDLGAGDYYTFGTVAYVFLVCQVNYRVAFINYTHNRYTLGALAFSFVGLALYLVVYPCWKPVVAHLTTNMYMTTWHFASIWPFWLVSLSLPFLVLALDSLWMTVAKRIGFSTTEEFEMIRATSYNELLQPQRGREVVKPWLGCLVKLPEDTREETDEEAAFVDAQAAVAEAAIANDRVNPAELWQQTRRGWHLIVSSWALRSCPIIGLAILFIIGYSVQQSCSGLQQVRVHYSGQELEPSMPHWPEHPWGTEADEVESFNCDGQSNCEVSLTVPRDLKAPLLVFYSVGPFYQNFNEYMKGEATNELSGKTGPSVEARRQSRCSEPTRQTPEGEQIVPCGSMAMSLFNDTIDIDGFAIDRTNIAWKSDLERFRNPKDYLQRPNTKWLPDIFPNVPREAGVTWEPFIVWMRPSFAQWVSKPYGWIKEDIPAHTVLKVTIDSSFPNIIEGGFKLFAITELGQFGGRSTGLGMFLCGGSAAALVLYLLALLLHTPAGRRPCPRGLASEVELSFTAQHFQDRPLGHQQAQEPFLTREIT